MDCLARGSYRGVTSLCILVINYYYGQLILYQYFGATVSIMLLLFINRKVIGDWDNRKGKKYKTDVDIVIKANQVSNCSKLFYFQIPCIIDLLLVKNSPSPYTISSLNIPLNSYPFENFKVPLPCLESSLKSPT